MDTTADTTWDTDVSNENIDPNITKNIKLRGGLISSKHGIAIKYVVDEVRSPKRRKTEHGNGTGSAGPSNSQSGRSQAVNDAIAGPSHSQSGAYGRSEAANDVIAGPSNSQNGAYESSQAANDAIAGPSHSQSGYDRSQAVTNTFGGPCDTKSEASNIGNGQIEAGVVAHQASSTTIAADAVSGSNETAVQPMVDIPVAPTQIGMAIAADSSRSAEQFNADGGFGNAQFDALFEQAVANIAQNLMGSSGTNLQEIGQAFGLQNLLDNPSSDTDQHEMTMPEQKYRPNDSALYPNWQSVDVFGKVCKEEPVENDSQPGMNKINRKNRI